MKSNKTSNPKATLLASVFGSNWFFGFIVIFFLVQTIWLALSGIYPMLFDEEYHLGIIDIYSRQISPFIHIQPPEAAFHGDITRYGSYLFHYIMSVPYSIIQLFSHDLQSTVIAMRFVCIAFVVLGLFVFRAFLLRSGLTKSLTHLAIGFFTLVPLVPFASSQISYDSLAFLMIASIFYLALRSAENSNKQILWIILLLSASSLASLMKFTILPIAFANVLFVAIVLWRKHNSKVFKELLQQTKNVSKIALVASLLLLAVGVGLFTERYVVNIIQYRAIEPKCDRIHSDENCAQYTVWRRDNSWKQSNDAKGTERNNPIIYTTTYWAPHIYSDYTVTAAFVYPPGQSPQIRYLPTKMQASAGAPILRYGSWVVLVASVLVLAFTWRKLPNRRLRYMVALTVLIYSVSLWIRNYTDYLNIGAGTAAQGRYFIPLLIPMLAVVGLAFRHVLTRMRYQVTFLVICLLLLSQGGGAATYLLYSNPNWYWPNNRQAITSINQSAKSFLKLFVIP